MRATDTPILPFDFGVFVEGVSRIEVYGPSRGKL
jgi:hypothetical protein